MDELELAILQALAGPNTSPSLLELARLVGRPAADVLDALERLESDRYVDEFRKARLGGNTEPRYLLTGDGREVLRLSRS